MEKLPAWLSDPDVLTGTIGESLKLGWITLSLAVAIGDRAGRRLKNAVDKPLKVNNRHYSHRVCDLPGRYGFRYPVREQSWTSFVEQVGSFLPEYLLKTPQHRVWDKNLACTLLRLTREHIGGADKKSFFDISTPVALMRSAYKLFERSRASSTPELEDLLSLVWFGLAVRGLRNMKLCTLCFRWAIPGHVYCPEHTQSIEGEGPANERLARYMHARRLSRSRFYKKRALPKQLSFTFKRLPQAVGRILWNTPLPHEDRTLAAIRTKLKEHPEVFDIIGDDSPNLSDHALYLRLSEKLDNYEINPAAWVWKIDELCRWRSAESSRRRRTRGTSLKTRMRIVEALFLAKIGYRKSEIANRLKISPSTISNWIKRGKISCVDS